MPALDHNVIVCDDDNDSMKNDLKEAIPPSAQIC